MELRKTVLIAFILSGVATLIYEIAWIRPLQFLLGSTTYTVSIIFAAFMLGLALGSWIISKRIENMQNIPKTYALLESGMGLYGVLLLSIFDILPKVYNAVYGLHTNFYVFEVVQFVLVFIVLLIPTTLMGAIFPIVARYYTKEKIGKGVGEIYAANNLGAIIGSFLAGFVLIPVLGIKASIIFAGAINILVASYLFLTSDKKKYNKIILIVILVFIALAVLGNYNIKQMHSGGFYRTSEDVKSMGEVVYYKEGLYATVTVRELPVKGYALFLNGKGQGDYEINDLRVNFLLSYLPKLIRPESEKALIIGLGTGTTSGQLSQLANVTTVEIEPAVVPAIDYFSVFNLNVLENENHTLVIDDGRNYLLKSKEKYDLIIPEPSDPWQSFSTALFSKEFIELASKNLNDNGLYIQWVSIYQMSPEDFRNFYKTFTSVFPNTVAFANIKSDEDTPVKFETSEIILIGSKNKINLDEKTINKNYNALPELSKQYLEAIRLSSGGQISHLLVFTSQQMEGYADNAKYITDDNLLLEFSTAKNVLNQNPQAVINDINNFLEKNE